MPTTIRRCRHSSLQKGVALRRDVFAMDRDQERFRSRHRNADFRFLPVAPGSGSDATWKLGITGYVQRRTRTAPARLPRSVPRAVGKQCQVRTGSFCSPQKPLKRWFDHLLTISRRDVEIEPILTIAYGTSTFLGRGAPQIALQIDYDRHLSNVPRKSDQVWTVGPVLSAKWKF
jgi:hypothetical protein